MVVIKSKERDCSSTILLDRTIESRVSAPATTESTVFQRGIVLSSQCSGSTWLCLSMNSSQDVVWGGEEMVHYTKVSNEKWKHTRWEDYVRDLEISFERVLTTTAGSTPLLVGFKLMYDQLPDHLYKKFATWLNDNQIIVVHLVRKASVLRYASHVEKMQRRKEGRAIRFQDPSQVTHPLVASKVVVDPLAHQVIQRHETHMEQFDLYLRAHAPMAPYMEITYESLTGPYSERIFAALSGFLGLTLHPITGSNTSLLRASSGICQDRVEQIEGELDGTRSEAECLILKATHNASFLAGLTDLLPLSKGDRCPFKFTRCIPH